MNLNQDFQEFVELFVAHEVEFLIVGGYALAAHGHPRYTKDLDVWVWIGAENASRIIAAIEAFGFGDLGLTAADGDVQVPFISVDDLCTNKLATGRPRDIADVADLPKAE
jgi:hypothetical protein